MTSHVLHIWTFTLCFQSFREGFSKIERRFRICHGFFEMFRPAYVNTLGRKNRPSTTLHNKTRTRIIDRYLTGEGPTAISTAAPATPGAVYCIIRHHETFGTCEAFSQGGRSYPSKLSCDVLESIEMFKLAKPRYMSFYKHRSQKRNMRDGLYGAD